MKLLAGLFLGAWISAVCASTIYQGKDNQQFIFGDWSVPQPLKVPASTGEVTLFKRTCILTVNHKTFSFNKPIDLIINTNSQELLLCDKMDAYSVVDGKILGAKLDSRCLNFAQSDKTDNAITSDVLIATAITNWLNNNSYSLAIYGHPMSGIDLFRVFCDRHATSQLKPYGVITETKVNNNSTATYSIKDSGNHELTLTITKDISLVSATKNGNQLYLISNGKPVGLNPSGLPQPIGPIPSEINIPSAKHGNVSFTATTWDLPYKSETGENKVFCGMAVISSDTGELWLGPIVAKVAEIGGKLLGVAVNSDTKELWLYTGKSTLPKTIESISEYQKQLEQYNKELAANNYIAAPHAKISLSNLFPNRTIFPADCCFEYIRHYIKDNNYAILLFNNSSAVEPEVTIDVNLRVVGTRPENP